jgi:hypothetical protein
MKLLPDALIYFFRNSIEKSEFHRRAGENQEFFHRTGKAE